MNTKLLRKVQRHILEEPKRFAMAVYRECGTPGDTLGRVGAGADYNAKNRYERDQPFPACGTIACIAGWARILNHGNAPAIDFGPLCSASDWPGKFRRAYSSAKTPTARAKIAATRIDHFIKTRGRE